MTVSAQLSDDLRLQADYYANPSFELTSHGKPWFAAQLERWASHFTGFVLGGSIEDIQYHMRN